MKKIVLKTLPILFISILLLFTSCNSDDEEDNATIKVDLKIIISGTLSDRGIIEYRSANGEIVKETLVSPSTWTKSFKVQRGFKMFLKATGTLEGSISMSATGKGDGVNSIGKNEITYGNPSVFSLEINKDLQ